MMSLRHHHRSPPLLSSFETITNTFSARRFQLLVNHPFRHTTHRHHHPAP
jgi:hypothetical protein